MAVAPDAQTAQLLQQVSISDDTYISCTKQAVTLQVNVLADAIQAKGDAVSARWNGIGTNDSGQLILSSP